MNLGDYSVGDADSWLSCRHCIGPHCKDYVMRCKVISTTKSGMVKVVVFGNRNWKDKHHIKNVRYVKSYKLKELRSE